jgi:magnesium chelatase family protein
LPQPTLRRKARESTRYGSRDYRSLRRPHQEIGNCILVGELSLDGGVRGVRGALPIALEARGRKISRMVVPEANAKEAAMVGGVEVYPIRSLLDVIHFVNSGNGIVPIKADGDSLLREAQQFFVDFKDVSSQQTAKRAIEIACAGGHNILMIGPPGSGKTMLAKRMPTIPPPLTLEEALETTKIHSVAGVLDLGKGLVGTRPDRSPHHTISDAGLIGGGAIPRPGEVSLAHNGLLFLDELPEFPRNVLEVLRPPRRRHGEHRPRLHVADLPGALHAGRRHESLPLRLSQRPHPRLPVHHAHDPALHLKNLRPAHGPHRHPYRRPRRELQRNALDQRTGKLVEDPRPCQARRQTQLERCASSRQKLYCNAQTPSRHIRTFCELSADCERLLERAMTQQGLSARAHDRILKVARTIADLEDAPNLEPKHIAEAIQYRSLDRTYWA